MDIELLLMQTFGYRPKREGAELKIPCHFCRERGYEFKVDKPKLSINADKRTFKCWVCTASGRLESLFDRSVDLSDLPPPRPQEMKKLRSNVHPPGYVRDCVDEARLNPDGLMMQYLRSRKRYFSPEWLDAFGVCWCVQGASFADGRFNTSETLIFPIYYGGTTVGWQARIPFASENDVPQDYLDRHDYGRDSKGNQIRPIRYFTSPGFPKGRVFFNWDVAMQCDFLVVTEGTFDAMAVGLNGIASLGKSLTPHQISLLALSRKPIVLLLDPDADADAKQFAAKLRVACRVFNVSLAGTGYEDAGDTPTEALVEIIRQQMEAQRV